MPEKRKVVIDCDTGVDDAIALLLAFRHLDVLGLTTVGGNVGLDNVQRNTRYVAQVAGREDIPVYAGYPRPMLVPLQDASHVHGSGGLGDIQVPEPRRPLERAHAVDFLIETFMTREDVWMVTTGPMTNLAQALLREPRLRERIPEVLCMAGSVTAGNATPAAEFNVYVDPEAARIVFESGIPIKIVGLNVCRQQVASPETARAIRELGSPAADLAYRLYAGRLGKPGMDHLCDACCLMWYCDDRVITKSAPMHVAVETRGEFTRGMTVCDIRGFRTADPRQDFAHERNGAPLTAECPPNAEVALELDPVRFDQVLLDTLRLYS